MAFLVVAVISVEDTHHHHPLVHRRHHISKEGEELNMPVWELWVSEGGIKKWMIMRP